LFRGSSRNFITGIFALFVLAFLAGPNIAPQLVSRVIPEFYAGQPCAWVRIAQDRAFHQSLIGRAAVNPLSVAVTTTAITNDPAGSLFVRILVTNNTTGTVPFVYNETQVLVGDNNTSGIGVIFNPANIQTAGFGRQDAGGIPEANIRLLGPRQRCVHTLEFPNGNVLSDGSLRTGTAQVRAYYRNNSAGSVAPNPLTQATPIYPDQGLWTGYIESVPVVIPIAVSP